MNDGTRAFQSLREAMTANEIADAQTEHYQLDDQIRRSAGNLTAAQKKRVCDFIAQLKGTSA